MTVINNATAMGGIIAVRYIKSNELTLCGLIIYLRYGMAAKTTEVIKLFAHSSATWDKKLVIGKEKLSRVSPC